MTRYSAWFGSLLTFTFFTNSSAFSVPVTETFDKFELNWSTMRLRFYGEALPTSSGADLAAAEKEATDKGLLYALNNLSKMRTEKGLEADSSSSIAHALTRQAFVYNTVYFSDGKIRVELEGSLVTALDQGKQGEAEPTASAAESSALIIEVANAKSPALVQGIQGSNGQVLYSHQNISKDAFRKQFTGRWFFDKSPELKSYSGKSPVKLSGELRNGKVIVDSDAWQKLKEKNEQLLVDAKIAYVLPSTVVR